MSVPPYARLAQLESQFMRGKISRDDFNKEKWQILLELKEIKETVIPIDKDKKPKEIEDLLENKFCYIPPTVHMLGENNEYSENKAGFYIAKYPVTVAQFVLFLENSNWDFPKEEKDIMWEVSPNWECPVSNISWRDAMEYCKWLAETTEQHYSLPFEKEWELAARGIDGRPYPWGYDVPSPDVACYSGETIPEFTVTNGTYDDNKSPFGCMDMVGNVWEFCLDEFDDPIEPHCLKGGSWCHDDEWLDCSKRIFSHPPTKRIDYGGFRIKYLPDDLMEEYFQEIEK